MADTNSRADELTVTRLIRSGESQDRAIECAPGIFESRGVGNSYLIVTPEGDVLVNAGVLKDARRGQQLFAKVSANPIRYIVLTQSHANQYGGLEVFKTPENQVVVHRNYVEDRRYHASLYAHYRRGSRRVFGDIVRADDDTVPTRDVPPDLLIDDHHQIELGGRRIDLYWTPGGETRSALIVSLPTERIAIIGNLLGPLFGNYPNLNTLRGDKPRSALEFIASVTRLRALHPTLILTGHECIRGAAEIDEALTRIIDAMQWVHDRTLEGMNAGRDLRSLMREITPPPELRLTEEYGKLSWNVRAIWHEYTGWFDPTRGITDLYGVSAESVARDVAELAGGADKLAERALRYVQDGRPLEALHLLDIALAATPDAAPARAAKLQALDLLLKQSGGRNLWETKWIASEIRELQN